MKLITILLTFACLPVLFCAENTMSSGEISTVFDNIIHSTEASNEPSGKGNHQLSGRVLDARNGEPLIGAAVFVTPARIGSTTDFSGEFTLQGLREGQIELQVNYLGYVSLKIQLEIPYSDDELTIEMESDFFRTQEVIVTATPTGSAVNYQSAQAYSVNQLSARANLSLGDMLDGEPGLSSRSFGGGPSRPVIRGFDGERLVVLENGERMGDIQSTAPDHAITLDPLGLSRVEVVRGPASLLYGSSALGGVINMFTEDAPRQWNMGLGGGIAFHGATNNNLLSGSAGLIYGTENQAFAGRLMYRTAGDANTPDEVIPNTGLESYTASVGWGYNKGRTRAGISGRYYQNHYGIPEFASESDPDNPGFFIEEEPEMEIRIFRYNAQAFLNQKLDGFFDEMELRASFSYSEQEEGEPDPLPEELELEIKTSTLSSTAMFMHRPFFIFNRGVIGSNLHYRYQEVDGIEAYHPGEDILNLALFTFQEVPLATGLNLQIGARFEQEWTSTVENRFFTPHPDPDLVNLEEVPPFDGISDAVFNFAGSLGLNYRPTKALEIGVQIARAHRNATVLERYADGWHAGATRVELGDPSLSSETGLGLDGFVKFTTERWQAEASGFYNNISNYVALLTLDNVEAVEIPYRVRADREFPNTVQFFGTDAKLLGFEAQFKMLLTENLLGSVTADYVRGTRDDETGDPLPFIPPFRTTFGLSYEMSNWNVGAYYRLVAAQNRVPDDELPTEGYGVARLEAGYQIRGDNSVHSFNIRVDNLLNTNYSDHMSVVRRFNDPVLGPSAPSRFDMPGINLNLMYRYSF
ncbi:MAG: TonB-dependent receptor [Saprospirales bacterium]|nr:MAG: TonB-dependent receptor [Saprospirales bacterium]